MRITILTGLGESEFASNFCLARALEKAGCETWLMGPNYDERRSILDVPEADYVLPDRPYPHFYSYKEVITNSPWKPDVIFAIDPRGAINGEKPRDIVSCFYSTDNHRAGELHTKLIKEGQYDVVFVGQGAYLPFLERSAPIVQMLWCAVEASRFPYDFRIEPECDIAFVGHTGLVVNGSLDQDRNGLGYCKKPIRKTYSGNAPSYDYAERGELLFRLCYDFNVRLYQPAWKTPLLSLALQQGKIGFNHSILHDLAIRNFEVMAAGRVLVTDDICLPPTLPSIAARARRAWR